MSTIIFWGRDKATLELARLLGMASMQENNSIQIKVESEAPLWKVSCVIGQPGKPDCVIALDDSVFYDFIFENLEERGLVLVKGNKVRDKQRTFNVDSEIGLLGALAATSNLVNLKSLINVTEQSFNNSTKDIMKKQLELGYEVAKKKVLGVGNSQVK